jgi:hypothetical protein
LKADIFIQDEITDRVAATLADNFGFSFFDDRKFGRQTDDQLSANEFVFRFFGFGATLTPEKHAQIR